MYASKGAGAAISVYFLLLAFALCNAKLVGRSSSETLDDKNFRVSFPVAPESVLMIKKNGVLQNYSQTFFPISFGEVDNSTGDVLYGSVPVPVTEFLLNETSLDWVETVNIANQSDGSIIKTINFTTTLPNGATVRFINAYYQNAHNISFPQLNFVHPMPPGTWKESIELLNWKPKNMSNLFFFKLVVTANPAFLGYSFTTQTEFIDYANVTFGYPDNNITEQLRIMNFVEEEDSKFYYADWYNIPFHINLETLTFGGATYYFYFPMWQKHFYYDPDLSVLVNDQNENSNGGPGDGSNSGYNGGGGSNNLVPILVPLFLGLAFIVFVIVVVIAIAISIWKHRAIRQRLNTIGSRSQTE